MSFIPTPNVAKVAVEHTIQSVPVVNTLWFAKDSPFSESDLEDLCDGVKSFWTSYIMANLSSTLEAESVVAWAQDTDFAPTFVDPWVPALAGSIGTSTTLPVNVALAVTFYSANRGRSSRGRIFLSGLLQSDLQDIDTWSSATIATFEAAMPNLNGGLFSLGMRHVIVSHMHNKVALTEGNAQTVTSYRVHPKIATMRKRVGR